MKGKATLVLAGVVLVGASTMASAARPAMTPQEKQELGAKAQAKAAAFRATQPRTSSQAATTKRTLRGGGTGVRVPTELWNTLGVQQDGKAPPRIVESDGTGVPATEGLPHE